jgi:hypothetical protein
LTLFLFCIQLTLAGSIVHYDVGNRYYYFWYKPAAHGGSYTSGYFTQTIISDTIINGNKYYVFHKSTMFESIFPTPSIDAGFTFYERSDSTKIYRFDMASQSEVIIIDFLDTLTTSYPQLSSDYAQISGKSDSFSIFNEYSKFIQVNFAYPKPADLNSNYFYGMGYLSYFGHYLYSSYCPSVYSYNVTLSGALIDNVVYGDTSLDVTDVSGCPKQIPTSVQLFPNYPNPFNPSTNISFYLPSKSFTLLKIYDLLGKELATIVSEELQAGNHSRQWNALGLPNGIYFYRLKVGSFVETRKLILLK